MKGNIAIVEIKGWIQQ